MIKFIMIHNSAVSYTKNKDQFKANNNYHRDVKDFPRSSLGYYLGYNYEISSKGKVRQARRDGEKTAGCPEKGMNDGRCIHIELDGDFDNEKPLPKQIYALRDLLRGLMKKYKIEAIYGHGEIANRTCPGKNIDMNWVRSDLANIKQEKVNKKEIIKQIKFLLDKLYG